VGVEQIHLGLAVDLEDPAPQAGHLHRLAPERDRVEARAEPAIRRPGPVMIDVLDGLAILRRLALAEAGERERRYPDLRLVDEDGSRPGGISGHPGEGAIEDVERSHTTLDAPGGATLSRARDFAAASAKA